MSLGVKRPRSPDGEARPETADEVAVVVGSAEIASSQHVEHEYSARASAVAAGVGEKISITDASRSTEPTASEAESGSQQAQHDSPAEVYTLQQHVGAAPAVSVGTLTVTCFIDAVVKICGIRELERPVRRCPTPVGDFGFDPRLESVAAFRAYVSDLKGIDKSGVAHSLHNDSRRVPIAVNTGSPGSGKTFQLCLLQSLFEHHGVVDSSGGYTLDEQPQGTDCLARGVYVTLNGPLSVSLGFDAMSSVTLRIHRRIIHAAAVRAQAEKGAKETIFQVDRFWEKLDTALSSVGDDLDDLLLHSSAVVDICHRLLGTPHTAPLLILFDELRKIDSTAELTAVSGQCVDALKCLASITQTCTAERVTQMRALVAGCPGPVFLVASAHAAIDVTKGFQTASNRHVYHLPLPPLDLSCGFDAKISQIVAAVAAKSARQRSTAQIVVRALARMHHGNPREFNTFLNKVIWTESAEQLTQTFFNDEINDMTRNVTEKASGFLMACSEASPPVCPVDLLRTLFWPCGYSDNSPDNRAKVKATLLAQSCGLCSILRMSGRRQDAVYMSPVAAKELCKALNRRPSGYADAREKAIVGAVGKLCNAMTKLPEMPPHFNSGKAYERVIAFAMACRALTTRTKVTVEELVLNREDPCVPERFVVVDGLEERGYDCFPRAAVLQTTTDDEKARAPAHAGELDAELMNYTLSGGWYNAEASELPAVPFYGLPARRYNVCADHMMVLPYEAAAAGETKRVTVLFQEKEWRDHNNNKTPINEGEVLRKLNVHLRFDTTAPAERHVEDSDVLVVYVTLNRRSVARGAAQMDARRRVEVVSHDDIREWCPMVAYSACDAHALNEIRNGPSTCAEHKHE